MAILQVNLRPATRFRQSLHLHDEGKAKDLIQPERPQNDVHPESYPDSQAVDSTSSPIEPNLDSPGNNSYLPVSATTPSVSPSLWQKIVWRLMPATTVGRAVIAARQRLDEAGCDTSSLDAQVILAYVLGVDRSWLFAHHDYKLTSEQATSYTDLIARRMNHEPVAYLIGRKEFYGLEFFIDPRVLIPRPETELLVDAVLDAVSIRPTQPVEVADVGVGSGAITLAVAVNCPQTLIYAIDISTDALAVAQMNVERLDSRKQVTLLQGDLLAPLNKPVDIIVANLPYVTSEEYVGLAADVRDYEPKLALEAGADGLDTIVRLLQQAPAYVKPGGTIFLEIGYNQGKTILALIHKLFPAADVSLRQDYHGQDRLVTINL